MITVVACEIERLGQHRVKDAKKASVRYEVAAVAELDRVGGQDYVILLDGMGSISVALSLLRMLIEVDAPGRLAIFGVTPEIRALVDAWERARLDELHDNGRLVLESDLSEPKILSRLIDWA